MSIRRSIAPNPISLIIVLVSSMIILGCAEKRRAVTVLSNDAPWRLATRPAEFTLSPQNKTAVIKAPFDSTSFTIRLQVNLAQVKSAQTLLDIPGVVKLSAFQHSKNDRTEQNYPAYPLADGTVPVLEAALKLYPPPELKAKDMRVGIPLGILGQPAGKHEVVLHFSGIRWTLYVDNELMDNDFALGYPKWNEKARCEIDPALVSGAEIFFPGIEPQKVSLAAPRTTPEIQYWTPKGQNSWVGDVATFYHQGRFHIFYLYDRRHHKSKFGKGAHYFEHLSTTDFKTWQEHDAATPIEEQWETFGTGTPFIFDNKLSLSYGLHTTRIYPKEKTTLPLLYDHLDKYGVTGSFRYDTLKNFPAGSTYSVSQDGISNFRKTKILFHPCENPSVYTDPQGRLRMLANYGARGTWESETITGGWRSVNPDFPPGGDCTFFFRWGNYDYVIGGFTGFWFKKATAPEADFTDGVKTGRDFYNGMSVPAVTEIKDGRFLLTGWVPMRGWGGAMIIHEMIQSPDGRIGTKWMKEVTPATGKETLLTKKVSDDRPFETGSSSFLLTFKVKPGTDLDGKLAALLFSEEGDANSCEVQISPNRKRAQFARGQQKDFSDAQKSLREGGAPSDAVDYAIADLKDTDRPFQVRIMVKHDNKFGGSLIDAEIAGQRTMISYRADLKVNKVLLRAKGSGITEVKISQLIN